MGSAVLWTSQCPHSNSNRRACICTPNLLNNCNSRWHRMKSQYYAFAVKTQLVKGVLVGVCVVEGCFKTDEEWVCLGPLFLCVIQDLAHSEYLINSVFTRSKARRWTITLFSIRQSLLSMLLVGHIFYIWRARPLCCWGRLLFERLYSRSMEHLFHRHRLGNRSRQLLVLHLRCHSAGRKSVASIDSLASSFRRIFEHYSNRLATQALRTH